MKNLQFIFLRLCIYLIAGILLAFYTDAQRETVLTGCLLVLILFAFSFIRARKRLFPDILFGITTFFLIFSLGFSSTYFSKPENQPEHYINKNIQSTDSLFVRGFITEELKPTSFSRRFILKTQSIHSLNENTPVKGKILLNTSLDSLDSTSLRPGIEILAPWQPEEVKPPLNPFQFDYRKYLKQLKIERQLETGLHQIYITGNINDNLSSRSWHLREKLIDALRKYDFKPEELAVFQALILGQRRDLSDRLYKNYAAAGAIHILAISGLHVGILLLILNFLFKPIEKLIHGKVLKTVIIIGLLWSFAFLTGLSASVVRAVCMFSFIAIGMQLRRKSSSLNSVFLSLFFLLIINPFYLFQAGFQLSYLAVISIIIFQPVIYKVFTTKFKILDYFWKLTSVSLAAQIGVIPLSLYYFHQFPGLFLLTNLVVLPCLALILGLGILVIFLAFLNLLPEILETLFSFILFSLNSFIEQIAGFETLVFSNIRFSFSQNLSLYLVILTVVLLLQKINFRRISFLLVGILIFQASTFIEKNQTPSSEAIVFHRSRQSVFAIKAKDDLELYSEELNTSAFLNDYTRERKIENIIYSSIPDLFYLSENLSLVIDTAGNYNIPKFQPELIILRNSPKVNLDRIIGELQPGLIVADGSNYKSYVELWKKTANNKKIPFHYTGEKGAYILSLKD